MKRLQSGNSGLFQGWKSSGKTLCFGLDTAVFRLLVCTVALVYCCLFFISYCSPTNSNAKTTITLSTWGSAQEVQVLKSLLSKFEARHPNIHVKLLHIPDNYFQKLHILIAGGLTPDVMFINSINFPIYASHGIFMDVTPELEQADFYPQALESFLWPKSVNSAKLGAFPRDISNLVVFYNRDWLKERQLSDPAQSWTWQDLIRYGKAMTEDKNHDGVPERFGFSFYTKPPLFWLPFVWSSDGALFDPGMNCVTLNQQNAIQGLKFIQDLRWKNHIAPRQEESGGVTMSQLFLQKKIAMLVSGRWSVPVFREQATFDWDIVPLPVGPFGKSKVGVDASGYAVSAKTPYRKESLALTQFLTSADSIREVTRSGLIVPARKEVAESPIFLDKTRKPMHGKYFFSVIQNGVPTQTPPRWNEFSEELMLALQPVWDGQQSPEEALSQDEILKLNQLLPSSGCESLATNNATPHPASGRLLPEGEKAQTAHSLGEKR